MADLHNDVYDNGLNAIVLNRKNLYLLSADPGLVWTNIALFNLGVKSAPVVQAPSDRSGGGRKVTVSAVTDGSVTATGRATHFAITDDDTTKILATGPLSAWQDVTDGNTFTLTEFSIGIPSPA